MQKSPVMEVHPPAATFDGSASSSVIPVPHLLELEVRRQLLAQPGLEFSSLVVRRTRDGVCLEGVVEVDSESPDVCGLAQRVAGVNEVINNLIHRRKPLKG